MNCIITLSQAYEVCFSLFLRVELLYKPFFRQNDHDLAELNRISEQLAGKISKLTFAPLRALLLGHRLINPRPATLAEAEALIAAIPTSPNLPADSELDSIADAKLATLLKELKRVDVHELRNKVVHKRAYRPTREEAAGALETARKVLLPVAYRLDLVDEIEWYRTRSA